MAKSSSKNGKRFADTFAIFYSGEDKCWVAHSLRTDQFGTGKSVLDAFVDGMRAVDQVVALAARKPGIEVFSEAPEEIQQIARRAQLLQSIRGRTEYRAHQGSRKEVRHNPQGYPRRGIVL